MPRTSASLRRLVGALEEIGRREDSALALGDGIAFADLERRAEPLARRVALLAGESLRGLSRELLERGRALVAARRERHHRLMVLLETTRGEIDGVDQARARARALRPAYSGRHARAFSTPSFSARG